MYRSSPWRSTFNTSYIRFEPENDHRFRHVSGKKNAANVCRQAQNACVWKEKHFERVLPSTKCFQNGINTSVCTPGSAPKHPAVCGTGANYRACFITIFCALVVTSAATSSHFETPDHWTISENSIKFIIHP